MPQLLVEFLTEEIPSRMQARAEADLERLLMDKLSAAGFLPEGVKAFAGPRRLAAVVEGLPPKQPDVSEERKGPRTDAPAKAIEGFVRAAGLASIAEATVVEDKKGAYYLARIERRGRETPELAGEIVSAILREFPWPKSMRTQDQDFRWVRPLRRVLLAFDGEAVPIAAPAPAGRTTEGHRFHAPAPFEVRRFDDYVAKLREARVVLDREERKRIILAEARTLCQARNLELVEDPGLVDETAGLVEWPVVLMGDMDPAFLDLPGEVIRLTMRTHQKYFAVRDPATGRLAPHFVVVANIEATDGGAAIAAGNARVLSARLNDARFFWEGDLKLPLDAPARVEKLKQIVFHQKLGSVWDKVERVAALARELAPACGADPALAERAARLAKMDLVTETVGEFPELQGQIGRQIFLAHSRTAPPQAGEQSLAAAIEDHYRPLGPSDRVPTDPVAVAVALADKLDTLTGFWAIDERPTGSSDPYALRRAALGIVRIVLENSVRLPLSGMWLAQHFANELLKSHTKDPTIRFQVLASLFKDGLLSAEQYRGAISQEQLVDGGQYLTEFRDKFADLLAFLADRLKVQLRDQGKRHDLVDAVFALGDDDLVRIVARVEALSDFLATEDGANLLAGYRRAANILKAEEKKDPEIAALLASAPAERVLQPTLLTEGAEIALARALEEALPAAQDALAREDFAGAMRAVAALRGPVDRFFDGVLVNAPDAKLRRNRLLLLARMRDALSAVADFSRIEG